MTSSVRRRLGACGCRISVVDNSSQLYCTEHGWQNIVSSVDFHIRCLDCRFSRRNLGAAPLAAHSHATRHSIARKHRVKVWCETDGRIGSQKVYGENRRQLSFDSLDEPPF